MYRFLALLALVVFPAFAAAPSARAANPVSYGGCTVEAKKPGHNNGKIWFNLDVFCTTADAARTINVLVQQKDGNNVWQDLPATGTVVEATDLFDDGLDWNGNPVAIQMDGHRLECDDANNAKPYRTSVVIANAGGTSQASLSQTEDIGRNCLAGMQGDEEPAAGGEETCDAAFVCTQAGDGTVFLDADGQYEDFGCDMWIERPTYHNNPGPNVRASTRFECGPKAYDRWFEVNLWQRPYRLGAQVMASRTAAIHRETSRNWTTTVACGLVTDPPGMDTRSFYLVLEGHHHPFGYLKEKGKRLSIVGKCQG